MNKVILVICCIIGLILEALGEMVIYQKTEPSEWTILIIAIINYLSVWFVMIITDDKYTEIIDYSSDASLFNNNDSSDELNEL